MRTASPPTRASTKAGKQLVVDRPRSSVAASGLSSRQELAYPYGTALPQSVSAIPPLASGEMTARGKDRASAHSFSLLPLQRKLAIGAVNDPLEAEADAMADRVMRGQHAASLGSGPSAVRRKCSCESGQSCPACEDEKNKLQRNAADAV